MGIALTGTPTLAESASSATIAVTVPTGRVAGEVLLCAVTGSRTTTPQTLTAPAGWDTVVVEQGTWSVGLITGLFYRVVTGTEPASYTWTKSGAAGRITGAMQRFSGVDTAQVLDVAADGFSLTSSTGTTVDSPTITTVTDDTLLVGVGALMSSASASMTQPASMTLINTSGTDGRRQTWAWEAKAAAGATGTRTWTSSSNALQRSALIAALRPAAAAPTTGDADGSVSFAGSAAGKRVAAGAGSGAVSFAGSAAGKRVAAGSVSGAVSFAGSAAGKTAPQGTGSGAVVWAGAAGGSRPSVGDAAGGVGFTGFAVATIPVSVTEPDAGAWVKAGTGLVLSDSVDTTGYTTPSDPVGAVLRDTMVPIVKPVGDLIFYLQGGRVGGTAGSVVMRLYAPGGYSTLLASSQATAVPGVFGWFPVVFLAEDITGISPPQFAGGLRVEFAATAA